jgi:hypothetical protein
MLRNLIWVLPDLGVVDNDPVKRGFGNLDYAPDRVVAIVIGAIRENLMYLFDDGGAESRIEIFELNFLRQSVS